jgi:hypothetical protein
VEIRRRTLFESETLQIGLVQEALRLHDHDGAGSTIDPALVVRRFTASLAGCLEQCFPERSDKTTTFPPFACKKGQVRGLEPKENRPAALI